MKNNRKRLSNLFESPECMNRKADSFFIRPQRENPFSLRKKKRVNLLALGDVGGMLLIGLRLLGTEAVSSIGICDLNEKSILRFEMEAGQIQAPFARERMPRVEIISPERLFDCDIFVFCASKACLRWEAGWRMCVWPS